jgi:hypothetical protein
MRLVFLLLFILSTVACASKKFRSDSLIKPQQFKSSQSKADPSGLLDLMSGEMPEKIEAPSEVTMLERPLAKFELPEGSGKTAKPFHFRVHTAFFDEDLKRVWAGGALYNQNTIYRSFLIYTDGGGRWFEAEPANDGVAFVYADKSPTNEFVAVESLYTEGSALSSFWSFVAPTGKWTEKQIQRTSKSGDVFKKNIGCCTEIVLDLDLNSKIWTMNLAGNEKSATFVSKTQGRTWKMQGKPGAFSLAKEKGLRQWLASPTDWTDEPGNPMILLEFSNREKPYQIPRYWAYELKSQSIRLKPLLK